MPISRQTRGVKASTAADPLYSRTLLLASDLQQSILAELDRRVPNPFAYSPYGLQSGAAQAMAHLGFNGQLKERSTGWYHLGNGHRVYNPVLMRFHSPDRLSPFSKGGINAYTYCGGDPQNYTDPTGQYVAVLQLVQRAALVTLHTVVPASMLLGPKVTGIALQASRFSLLGSVGTAAGAAMSAAGSPYGVHVITAGTAGLLAGAMTRGLVAVKDLYQKGQIWKTFKTNVKNIFTGRAETKVSPTVGKSNSVVIDMDVPAPPSATPNLDSPASPRLRAIDIRRPDGNSTRL